MNPSSRWQRVDQWIFAEGSTRAAGILRLCLPPLIWTRFGSDFLLYQRLEGWYLAIGISFFASTGLMFVGLYSRFATTWAACTMLALYFFLGFDQGVEPYTHHHTYLLVISTCLCALTPCNRSYSLDRLIALRWAERDGTPPPREWGSQWGMRLVAIQVSSVYFWTAYNKTNWAFLSGERMEHIFTYLYLGSDYPEWSTLFQAACVTLSVGTVALEYALAGGLWVRRWQRWLFPLGVLFHISLYVLLPVATFSLNMCLLYVAFVEPEAFHRFTDRFFGSSYSISTPGNSTS